MASLPSRLCLALTLLLTGSTECEAYADEEAAARRAVQRATSTHSKYQEKRIFHWLSQLRHSASNASKDASRGQLTSISEESNLLSLARTLVIRQLGRTQVNNDGCNCSSGFLP